MAAKLMKPAHSTRRRTTRGSTLPVCLLLTGIIGIVALNTLRSATAEIRLGQSVKAAHQAFNLAERGISMTLNRISLHPTDLPTPTDSSKTIGVMQPLTDGHSIYSAIQTLNVDSNCPMFDTGERSHYEIHSTGVAGSSATRIHIQGFYICRESCSTDGCLSVETLPELSYWTHGE
jgi:hypothetical protein